MSLIKIAYRIQMFSSQWQYRASILNEPHVQVCCGLSRSLCTIVAWTHVALGPRTGLDYHPVAAESSFELQRPPWLICPHGGCRSSAVFVANTPRVLINLTFQWNNWGTITGNKRRDSSFKTLDDMDSQRQSGERTVLQSYLSVTLSTEQQLQ